MIVNTYVGPAVTNRGFDTTYRYTGSSDSLKVEVEVKPRSDWSDISLPRVGIRLGLSKSLERFCWSGLGPNESYPDTRLAGKVGQYDLSIHEMQHPTSFLRRMVHDPT